MKLGVFDSGIGGEAVAASLRADFSSADVIVVNDKQHVPYGDRKTDEIIRLTDTAIQPLLEQKCDVIVIACNTATAAAIEPLRIKYPDQKFIGLEPMVKTACQLTKTGVVGICATPATLQSDRYHKLKETYADSTIVIEPNCRDWARLIENNLLDETIVRNEIKDLLAQNADVVVLACTHYHWIRTIIEEVTADRAKVIDPTEATARRIKEVLLTPQI